MLIATIFVGIIELFTINNLIKNCSEIDINNDESMNIRQEDCQIILSNNPIELLFSGNAGCDPHVNGLPSVFLSLTDCPFFHNGSNHAYPSLMIFPCLLYTSYEDRWQRQYKCDRSQ